MQQNIMIPVSLKQYRAIKILNGNVNKSAVEKSTFIDISTLPVFIITSVLSAGFDLVFVVMQRYNRPRIIKLIKRNRKA